MSTEQSPRSSSSARAGHAEGPRRARARTGRAPKQVSRARLDRLTAARTAVALPPITYPEQLPVSARRADIATAIDQNQVVILAGETGSGKTTQLPKILLGLGRGRTGQIGHTQPRRIAARTVAERIAEELNTPLGDVIGYQVRFTDTSSDTTLVKVMTDGILLAQIQRDPDLLAYDTIIIDEAHERSLNIDFLLGYLTRLLARRPDLKVVITSATIDSQRFAAHFSPAHLAALGGAPPLVVAALPDTAPVIEVSGRTYPVEIRYRPLTDDRDLMTGIVDACDELLTAGPGDILVFLSGEREIRDAADALDGHLGSRARDPRAPGHIDILPLYARLSAAEQHRVFERHSARRIVLATNVAETSLTVPGIHYVVDPGTARISRYSKATKVQRLPIEPISQASANQRSGRSGRIADGIAIRLYTADDFAARPEFTEPEILRTSLASVLLHMISVGVVSSPHQVAQFPFVEPPDTRAIRDGVHLLTELGALETVEGDTRLTDIGRVLAHLPMDPRLARMILHGSHLGVASEVAVIASALSIQDPRERPAEERAHADQLHARFTDPTSDFITYLNLWEYLRELRRELSSSALRRRCKAEYINYLRVREWQDVVSQLREMGAPLGIEVSAHLRDRPTPTTPQDPPPPDWRLTWDTDTIHRALLAGLLSHIGMQDSSDIKASAVAHLKGPAREQAIHRAKRQARNEYTGARGARFAIFPGSPLSKKPPAWIMAGELVETSRLWARDVARINPEWAEELAGNLAKRTYSEPHWSTKQGAAMAREKVLLYGVPIIADRTVHWARIDPAGAREIFLRRALVEGAWTTRHEFFHRNRELLAQAEEIEARSRTRGLIVDDEVLFDFYDERIPHDVVSTRHFDRWWKDERHHHPDLLTFTLDFLVPHADAIDTDQFPETWPQGELLLPLTYQFDPGTDADGVTVHIPIAVLNQVSPCGFDRMVPGLLEELCTATIRSLPKAVRVQLVPAPDVGRDIAAWLREHTPAWTDMARAGDMAPPFHSDFARAVRSLRDVTIETDVWTPERAQRLPAHLRMTFRVTDPRPSGTVVLDESDDLASLRRRLAPHAHAAVRAAVKGAVGRALTEAADAHPRPRAATPPGPTTATSSPPASPPVGEQTALRGWPDGLDGGILPEAVAANVGGTSVLGYPALVVEPGARGEPTVALRILADATHRDTAHGDGIRALLLGTAALATGRITSRWSGTQSLTLAASPYRSTDALVTDLQRAAIAALTDVSLERGRPSAATIRDADSFQRAVHFVRGQLEQEVYRVVGDTVAALSAARTLDSEIRGATSMALLNTLTDLRDQAGSLIFDGFLTATPPHRLRHLARYLRGASHRLSKAAENPNRDAELAWRIHDVQEALDRARQDYAAARPDPARAAELAEARWLIEELRVSLFAQHLGTDGPVSEKRIRKVLAPNGG